MSVELKLLDQLKLANHLSRNFACSYSEDDRFFILTDMGVYIFALKGNLSSPFQELSTSKYFLPLSDFSPSTETDLDINSFHNDLERKDLYETVLTKEYSVNLNHIKPIEVQPLSAEWSPPKMVGRSGCLLAVLSSLHNLEVYFKRLDENEMVEYLSMANLTKAILKEEEKTWKNCLKFPVGMKLDEYKKRIVRVSPTAFTWGHVFDMGTTQTCVIFVGLMNGDISIWRVNERDVVSLEDSEPFHLGRFTTKSKRITTLHWHPTSNHGGALCVGDIEGKVNVLHFANLETDKASLEKDMLFCPDSDKVVVDKITVMEFSNCTFLIIVKQQVLIIYGIDKTGKIFDHKVHYVEELYITGIHHFNNSLLVLTLPGIFTQLTLSVKNEEITVEEKKIPLKVDKGHYRTHGFFCTRNMAIFTVLMYPWEMQQFSSAKTYVNLFVYANSSLNPFTLLWNNPSGSLEKYWDCLEALRIICLKEKRFPWLGLPADLNYDTLSLLQLKTLRCVAQISENVFECIPVLKDYHIKPYVLLNYLVEIKLTVRRLKRLLIMRQSGKELTTFQLRSMDLQNFFLKEMVLKNILPKSNVGENFIREITEVMEVANELTYPDMMQCGWCGEKLIGSMCVPIHSDTRCCFSMMPICLVPAYKCLFCNSMAHNDIEKEESSITCPYCDIPMEKLLITLPEGEGAANYVRLASGEVKSKCFQDCLKEEVELEDIGDSSEYVIFSDSDGEENSQLDKLYLRMSHLGLDEMLKVGREDSDEPMLKVVRVETEGLDNATVTIKSEK